MSDKKSLFKIVYEKTVELENNFDKLYEYSKLLTLIELYETEFSKIDKSKLILDKTKLVIGKDENYFLDTNVTQDESVDNLLKIQNEIEKEFSEC